MKTKLISTTAVSALAALSAFTAAPAVAADWNDTYLGFRRGSNFREPNNPNLVSKDIIQLTHASGYKYGSNFLNVDTFISGDTDKANNSTQGAHEIYVTYRHQLSLGATTGLKTKVGPLRDVSLTAGFDLNSKDTTFAPRKRALVLGPTIKFDVPGFLDVSLLYYREQNHKGIPNTPRPDITFDGTYMLTASWGIPFQLGSAPLKFQGFVNYIGDKGLDYNNVKTANETLMRTSLMMDVGQMAFDRKNAVWAGIGFEYWRNKFGNQPGVGTDISAPQIQLEFHF